MMTGLPTQDAFIKPRLLAQEMSKVLANERMPDALAAVALLTTDAIRQHVLKPDDHEYLLKLVQEYEWHFLFGSGRLSEGA